MPKVKAIKAREILDSRGNPTIETTVWLDSGHSATASIPSGSSIGETEAFELRDHDQSRFGGMGVLKAVANVNQTIAPKIIGMEAGEQTKIDQALIDLDGSQNKINLGGNSLLSVSIAVLKASAESYHLPVYRYLWNKYHLIDKLGIPHPTFNIINGGKHGAGNLDFQEFHLIPSIRYPYHQALEIADEIYRILKKVLQRRHAVCSVGDEGGYAPNLFSNMDALEIIQEAIKATPYQFAKDVFVGLDIAASFFHRDNQYYIKDRAQPYSTDDLIAYYSQLNREYRLFSLEDPLENDDWKGWAKVTENLSHDTLIIGDDLLTTNKHKIDKAIAAKACNAVLIKPNQNGTISETLEVVKLSKLNNLQVIVSHRSGETNDSFVADFAVGVGADYTKFGAPARGERIVKYNRLLAIESELKLS